jgi:hypothetical protein
MSSSQLPPRKTIRLGRKTLQTSEVAQEEQDETSGSRRSARKPAPIREILEQTPRTPRTRTKTNEDVDETSETRRSTRKTAGKIERKEIETPRKVRSRKPSHEQSDEARDLRPRSRKAPSVVDPDEISERSVRSSARLKNSSPEQDLRPKSSKKSLNIELMQPIAATPLRKARKTPRKDRVLGAVPKKLQREIGIIEKGSASDDTSPNNSGDDGAPRPMMTRRMSSRRN